MKQAALIRTAAFAEQRPWALLAIVFLATLFFGFVTQAAGSAYLGWIGDPIVLHYRTTLSYASALIGDAILIPIANVAIVSQLVLWRRRPHAAEIASAIFGGALLTLAAHLYQAANEILNWTMLAPYAWTPLGYVHAVFMVAELSFVFFFWGQVARIAQERPRAIFSQRVLIVVLCILVFMRLLLGDYGYLV